MRTSHAVNILFLLVLFSLPSCRTKQDGAVEGTVTPPGSGARISAAQSGKTVSTIDAGIQDGKFRVTLPAGTYDVGITSPSSPFPLSFPGITVESGKTTTLPPIELTPPSGTAALSGIIAPGAAGARVTLLYEGKERATINLSPEGKYEFTGLPAGRFTVQANAPGYADDAVEMNLGEAQKAAQNIRLLSVTAIDGVDWASGKIRARGRGLPPKKGGSPTIMHEMAKRAALGDARRNLLRILEQIKVDPNRDLESFLGKNSYPATIQGFIGGHTIIGERALDGGGIEVELELPLTGPAGLTRLLVE